MTDERLSARRARRDRCGLAFSSAVVALTLVGVLLAVAPGAAQPTQATQSLAPEARAVAYLAVEVPRWQREHACYSCHNNGDATRALLAASRHGHTIGTSLDDTLAWLSTPSRWEDDANRGASENLPLGRIQFSGALTSMLEMGRVEQGVLDQAAALVIGHQQADGAWQLNPTQLLGGATFYGTALATTSARGVLAAASSEAARVSLDLADDWLRSVEVETVLDASSVLLGLGTAADQEASAQRARCLAVLERGQAPDGGWGPYVTSRSDVFDTALAVLALSGLRDDVALAGEVYSDVDLRDAVNRGRNYLTDSQTSDGSWVETTRPSGLESYAPGRVRTQPFEP